ncbi:MAG TPA: hypothetical protein VI583_06025, partial [Cyclobacteriaceae bacterium]|nr:hypothetical protein [Cyclobacteriaceae bacterium]
MKKIISAGILFFMLISSARLFAQTDVRNSLVYRIQMGVYNRAIKYNDYRLAVNALYNMSVLEPENDSLLIALQYIYFN